jgi:hypothetical protein
VVLFRIDDLQGMAIRVLEVMAVISSKHDIDTGVFETLSSFVRRSRVEDDVVTIVRCASRSDQEAELVPGQPEEPISLNCFDLESQTLTVEISGAFRVLAWNLNVAELHINLSFQRHLNKLKMILSAAYLLTLLHVQFDDFLVGRS